MSELGAIDPKTEQGKQKLVALKEEIINFGQAAKEANIPMSKSLDGLIEDLINGKDKMVSFKNVLGQNYSISSVDGLKDRICECIENSISCRGNGKTKFTENRDSTGGIVW